MVQAGDPLELRFKMTVGTAQAGGTYPGPRSVTGARLRSRTSRESFAPPWRAPAKRGPEPASGDPPMLTPYRGSFDRW